MSLRELGKKLKTLTVKLRAVVENTKITLVSALVFLAMEAADVYTTGLPLAPGFIEGNPYMRHFDGTFWLAHGIVVKLFRASGMTFYSALVYWGANKVWGKKVADFLAAVPWLWYGFDLLMTVVFPNYFNHLGYYVVVPGER